MNEYRKLLESLDKILNDINEASLPEPVDDLDNDPVDVVTMDVPLMIRLFELMHETVQSDAELHEIVTKIISVSKDVHGALTMEQYNEILNGSN